MQRLVPIFFNFMKRLLKNQYPKHQHEANHTLCSFIDYSIVWTTVDTTGRWN